MDMVVLILSCSSNFASSLGSAYKVRDSTEDISEDNNSDFSKYFGNSPFIFPDYFTKSEEKSIQFSDEFGSSEPSESRSVSPQKTDFDGSNKWKNSPSFETDEQRSVKDPILSLYDDWSPENDDERSKGQSFKSVGGVGGGIGGGIGGERESIPVSEPIHHPPTYADRPGPPYKTTFYKPPPTKPYRPPPPKPYKPPNYRAPPLKSQPLKNIQTNSYRNPKPILTQHYKPARPVNPSFSPSFRSTSPQKFNNKGVSVHQHQFGVSHDYVPKRNPEDNDAPSFRSASPQKSHFPPRPPQNTFFGYNNDNAWKDFKPSPPDNFQNKFAMPSKPNDFLTDFSNLVPKKVKENPKSQKNNCIKTTKTNQSTNPVKWMSCSICVDDKTGRQYEQCSEEPENKFQSTKKPPSRGKRSTEPRGKRQYDYSENDDHQYGPDNHEYRFGPEHFIDEETPVDDTGETPPSDSPQEAETCWKKRKGEMLCIVCENTANGGTYEQCAYGSDPKKNSYERSVSKVYGSPRLPEQKYMDKPRSVSPQKPKPRWQQKQQQQQQQQQPRNRYVTQRSNQPYKPRFVPNRPQRRNPDYTTANHHKDVNRPRISSNIPLKPRKNTYGVPDPYNPKPYEYEPPNYPLTEQRKSYNDEPYGPSETFPELFPELNSSPVIPTTTEYGDYDVYDEDYIDAGEPVDGQGQFSINQQKKLDNPSSEQFGENREEYMKKADDFSNKNRTSCIKVFKEEMTCFQCVDARGSKNEECMYIAGNEPKTKQLSFRETKEFNYEPIKNQTNSEFYPEHINRGKRKFKKFHPDRYDADTAQSIRQPRNANKTTDKLDDKKNKTIDLEAQANMIEKETKSAYNPIPTEPSELSEIEEDNIHSDETELTFDPDLGVSLPRYMLEKSEHEAIFDEALASG